MSTSPRNVTIAFDDAGLTHYGGVVFFHTFLRVLQFRRFHRRHLHRPRRNQDYNLPQMVLDWVYPIILGLDRLETASFLRRNGTFQYPTGLGNYPARKPCAGFCCRRRRDFRSNSTGSMNDCCDTSFISRNTARA